MQKFNMKLREKCKCPNNGLFITALILVIIFLLFELTFRIYNLYQDVPSVDIPSHFFGGMALAAVIFWLVSLTLIERKKAMTMVFTLSGALFWEVMETLQELVFENPPYLRDSFVWDGFWDTVVTIIGGGVALLLVYYLKNKTNLYDHRGSSAS